MKERLKLAFSTRDRVTRDGLCLVCPSRVPTSPVPPKPLPFPDMIQRMILYTLNSHLPSAWCPLRSNLGRWLAAEWATHSSAAKTLHVAESDALVEDDSLRRRAKLEDSGF